MYNYRREIKQDIKDYIRENNPEMDFDSLYDTLWTEDSVTGNGSGSYTCNRYRAKEMVSDNDDLVCEAVAEFCIPAEEVAKHLTDWEYWDVTIRCSLLGECLADVLEEAE